VRSAREARLGPRATTARLGGVVIGAVDVDGSADRSQGGDRSRAVDGPLPQTILAARHDLYLSARVSDDHVFAERIELLVVLELLSAVILFGGGAQDFNDHRRVDDGLLVLGIARPGAADDGDVWIGREARRGDAHSQIGHVSRQGVPRICAAIRAAMLKMRAECSGVPPAMA